MVRRASKSTIAWNKALNFIAELICNEIKIRFIGLGDDWHAVILETSVEIDYVLNRRVAPCPGFYSIGGSTNSNNETVLELVSMNNSYYIPNDSGT